MEITNGTKSYGTRFASGSIGSPAGKCLGSPIDALVIRGKKGVTPPDDDDRDDPSGLAIRIEYRPEAGLVIFRVGDGLPVTLSGFGAPLRLRPWAYTMYEEDRLAFERRFIEYDAEFKNIVAC